MQLCSCSGDDEVYIEPIDVGTVEDLAALPIIAHRGCWSGDSLPQNSLASFRKALRQNIYGTEFDVRQTLDGQLVINHDATFNGKEISQTRYADLCAKTLPNGETIPLLEEFVKTYVSANSKVLMVVELKACRVDDFLTILRQYDVLSHVCFISFSRSLCSDLVTRGYGTITYYLGSNLSPRQVKDYGYGGIDYSHSTLQEHPDWIHEAQQLGLWTGVWTVNDEGIVKSYIDDSVIVTTDWADKMTVDFR
ncbi:MAG: hypothetical protein IKH91_05805 [Prevotella sp.]|nr:hypothetical protein [Prevotella sp.]